MTSTFGHRRKEMRIIKLSPKDIDFPDRSSVYDYFRIKSPSRSPVGQFLLTRSRIAEEGISVGEPIIFSYEAEITHIAKAASGRLLNAGGDRETYPFYFIVDMSTDFLAKGSLADLENALSAIGINKNIIRTQGWPRILDSLEADKIWNKFKK